MKIYIQEDNCFFLAKNNKKNNIIKILENLNKYLIKKESIIDVYSKQGIYQINDNKIHKLNTKTENIYENSFIQKEDGKNIKLLIDDSIIEKELAYQIPYEHVNIPLYLHRYSLHNKTKHTIILVIEFIHYNKEIMTPINYYFEYQFLNSDNNKNIPTEDINVFLSLLN
jgi:hypothetical protein